MQQFPVTWLKDKKENQRKTEGQQLKDKIVSAHTFSEFFSQDLALFKSPSGGGLTKMGSVTF